MKLPITVGLLSWRAHKTLEKTLSSYKSAKLPDIVEDSFIYFNAISDEDRAFAERYGWRAEGSYKNLGIWGGMDAIADLAKTKYVLFLQNDCPIIVSSEETRRWVEGAVELLESGKVDMVHLRHRIQRGQTSGFKRFFSFFALPEIDPRALEHEGDLIPRDYAKDTLYRRLHRWFRPDAARRQMNSFVYLGKSPDRQLPKYVSREGDFFIVDSAILNFTEQPFLISKKLYLELSQWSKEHPTHRRINGFPVMEHILNSRWWRNRHFKIAVCDEGVFTHNRFDDSWRVGHEAYNAELKES